jgi:hypothetical protein
VSVYFAGSKPGSPFAVKLAPAAKAAPAVASAPAKVVQVRAHTRAAPVKPVPATAPTIASPKAAASSITTTPAAAKTTAFVNPQTLRPAQVSTVQRFAPHYPGEPVAGTVGALRNLDGSWAVPGGKAIPGAYLAPRPYYTDAYTLHARAGPAGQQSTQWNAAQVAEAHRIQLENYGQPGYFIRSLIPGGLDEGPPTGVGHILGRAADIATTVLPGGGVGEAAGLLGLGLLKGLRGARVVKGLAETAPKAATAVEHVYPKGTLFHGSPGGQIQNIDALYHTRTWREGPGFYLTPSIEKARQYAAGKSAVGARKAGAVGEPGLHALRLKPGTKVLNMDTQPRAFWENMAERVTGEKPNPATYEQWARDIGPAEARGASQGVLERMRLLHYLTGYYEMPQTDAYYAIEEALHEQGVHATLHHEGGVPVFIAKDSNAVEHVPVSEITRAPVSPVRLAGVPEEAAVVRVGLKGAKLARAQQEAGYSAERAARFARAEAIRRDPGIDPVERYRLVRQTLAGELPKINFQGFNELNDQSLPAVLRHIQEHPTLSPGQKTSAEDAVVKSLQGVTPQTAQIRLLEHLFGKQTAAGLAEVGTSPYKDLLWNAMNVPRALMSSVDLSAPFRQGLMVATRHPSIFFRNWGSSAKQFGSQATHEAVMDSIKQMPTYEKMLQGGLGLTEFVHAVEPREERFASDLAETLTGGKYSPVRASGRAYTGFLNKTRADVFDHLYTRMVAQDPQLAHDDHFVESLARYINNATGRGGHGAFAGSAKVLNATLFSPRLLASRLNAFNPRYYASLHPAVRKEALRSSLQLAGTLTTLAALASQVPGVKVATDPRNPDWGKIRVGNTRIDLAGGFQQPLRLLAQLATGTAISSTTGKRLSLTSGGFGKPTRPDLLIRFLRGKLGPLPSLLWDVAAGSNVVGQKLDWGLTRNNPALQRMVPLVAQDAADLYRAHHGGTNGLAAALAGYGVGALGLGVQTYGPKPPKGRTLAPAGYFGGFGP